MCSVNYLCLELFAGSPKFVFFFPSISSSENWTPVEIRHQPCVPFPRNREKEKEYSAETKPLNLSAG